MVIAHVFISYGYLNMLLQEQTREIGRDPR